MIIRPYADADAAVLAALSATCIRGEGDFVLNPLWETEEELRAEFTRFGIEPEAHLLVADAGDGEILGFTGFLRQPAAAAAGMICPIVAHGGRGRGIGGELLRAAQTRAAKELGIRLVTAAIGTRNRAGYSLLSNHGFRPVRQHFFMRCYEKPTPPEAMLEGIALELATAADSAAINEIYRSCGFEPRSEAAMRAVLEDERHYHAVARSGGEVVAFVELETHWPRKIWVAYVGVAGDRRDRGVGTALVAWALQRRFDAGAVSAMLLLSPANRSALRAYEKVGFRRSRLIDVLEKHL
jgi:ribosomal protein S18 acetylase RimI-like enzyme